jgi:prenyltransferase beta subunit
VTSRRSLAVLLIVATLAALFVPAVATSPAAPRWTGNLDALSKTMGYLQKAQNADGGFGGRMGGASDPLFSAWVAMALAAGGINPQDQKGASGVDVFSYIVKFAGKLDVTTDFERVMLATIAAGANPRDFGGRDLIATILSRQSDEGWFPHEANGKNGGVNDTAFAVLPLSTVDDPVVRAAIRKAVDWLLTVQEQDGASKGGWGFAPHRSIDSDMTGAVIQALRVAGRGGGVAEKDAWAFIRKTQQPDGGFGVNPNDTESNVASTSWVVQAMWAAGIDPNSSTWRRDGGSPLDYLVRQQQQDGSIKYKASGSMNDLWMTAYAAPAFAGYPLPIPTVPREDKPADTGKTQDGGVTSGGGGGGAPLFSRPQPQSDGDTSGGVRVLKDEKKGRGTTKAKPRAATQTTPRTTPTPATTPKAPGQKKHTGTAQSNGVAKGGVTPVRSKEKRPGGTSPEPTVNVPAATGGRGRGTGTGSGDGEGDAVTGRLLGRAPAGSGGSGRADGNPAAAFGLRSATPPGDASGAAIVLAVLLAALALAGARFESATPREALP